MFSVPLHWWTTWRVLQRPRKLPRKAIGDHEERAMTQKMTKVGHSETLAAGQSKEIEVKDASRNLVVRRRANFGQGFWAWT